MAILINRSEVDEFCDETRNCLLAVKGMVKRKVKLRTEIANLEVQMIKRLIIHEEYVNKFRAQLYYESKNTKSRAE